MLSWVPAKAGPGLLSTARRPVSWTRGPEHCPGAASPRGPCARGGRAGLAGADLRAGHPSPHSNFGNTCPPSCQFDFSFVEVYRVKRFQFVSKQAEDEEGEPGKQGLGQICSHHPPCCCAVSRSSWNCDGEVLHSPALEVRWVRRPSAWLGCRGCRPWHLRFHFWCRGFNEVGCTSL